MGVDAILCDNFSRIFYHDFACVLEEEVGESFENRKAIAMLKESIQFDEEKKKYVITLPWKATREEAMRTLNSRDSKAMAL